MPGLWSHNGRDLAKGTPRRIFDVGMTIEEIGLDQALLR